MCSVFTAEERRFVLIFPEDRGLLGGWLVLAQKLRSYGVMSPHGVFEDSSGKASQSKRAECIGDKVSTSYAEMTKGPRKVMCDSVWLHFGN